jgi:O-methyltransferase
MSIPENGFHLFLDMRKLNFLVKIGQKAFFAPFYAALRKIILEKSEAQIEDLENRLKRLERRIDEMRGNGPNNQVPELQARLTFLENRLIHYYRNRWDAIDNLADYLVGAEIPGDYLEFGVYKGTTFSYACRIMAPIFEKMRFYAFDSFEGLPEPSGIDAKESYTSGFFKGQYALSEEDFIANLRSAGVDLNRVEVVKGWFDQTLYVPKAAAQNIEKIAAAWIDCDLYESTVPVLQYITSRLSVGAVILFDDWRCFRNLSDFGQQRACKEWMDANPHVRLRELFQFGWHGQAFSVGDQ